MPNPAQAVVPSQEVDSARIAMALAHPGQETEAAALRLNRLYARTVVRRISRLPGGESWAAAWTPLLASGAVGSNAWCPELGWALAHAAQGRATAACVQAALGAVGLGASGEWGFSTPEPVELMFAGHRFVLGGDLTLRAEGGQVEFRAGARPVVAFQGEASNWQLTQRDSDAVPVMMSPLRCRVGGHAAGVLATGATTLDAAFTAWPRAAELLSPQQLQAQVDALSAGAACLDRMAPDYAAWAGRMVRCFLILADVDASTGSEYLSLSHVAWPGLVALGFRDSTERRASWPVLAADTLVHESSHQYFHLLSVVLPLVNGRDTRLYYSALAKRERPIDRVMLAYHAAGNMALAHAAVLDTSEPGSVAFAHAMKKAAEAARSLREPLERTDGLTEAGSALWRTLAKALDARSLG
jgi:HEXXH motif-containing protein